MSDEIHKALGELNSEIRYQEKRIADLLDERDARDLENIELRRVIATLKVGEQTEGWFVSEITEDEDERVVARLVSLLRNGGGGTVSSDDDEDVRHWKVGDVVDMIDAEWKRLDPEPESEPESIASHGGAVESNPPVPNRWIHDDSN